MIQTIQNNYQKDFTSLFIIFKYRINENKTQKQSIIF